MYRDVSAVLPSSCYVIIDGQTLVGYQPTIKQTYKLVSNQYYLISTEPSTSVPAELNCYNTTQLAVIPSNYDFMNPILQTIAIGSALAIFFLAYRLILYPFYRKRV